MRAVLIGGRSVMLGVCREWNAESGKVRQISREFFSQNSNLYDHELTIPQRHRRTDRHTDRQLALAIPRFATLRAVKTMSLALAFLWLLQNV